MDNYQDIFNLNNDDFIEKETSKESDFYKPDPKRGKDNVYKSLIRFVPFHKDPKKSKVKKYHYWLVDPLTGDGISVDCPSTVNQKSVIQDTFWKLKKSQMFQTLFQNWILPISRLFRISIFGFRVWLRRKLLQIICF